MLNQTTESFEKSAKLFVEQILKEIDIYGLLDEVKSIDHICYRVSSISAYEAKKNELKSHGKLHSELHFNGRPISIFKLKTPISINYNNRFLNVEFIELPAPKKNVNYQEGYEHIEVIPHNSLLTIVNNFHNIDFETKNINNFKNPEISLLLNSGRIKFHDKSLEQIIMTELEYFHKKK